MEMRKVVVEVPKRTKPKEVRDVVKRLFSFNVNKYYGKSKNFPMVRVKWQLSA